MNLKKQLITILTLFIIIFMISAVSAEDINDELGVSNVTSEIVSAEEVSENLEVSNEVEVLSDADDGSFSQLETLISETPENGVLELNNDFEFIDGDTVQGGMYIDKTITINGNNHKIDAKGKDGIFYADSDGIIFKDIIFTNSNSDYGGAIYSTGSITVINCTFINNQVSKSGGALYLLSTSSVINSTFENNIASSSGGAIYSYVSSSFGSIINSTFADNVASNNGGAIYCYANSFDNVVNSTFIRNSANYGGGVYNEAYTGNFDRCIFINNTATSTQDIYGAGKISNSIFINSEYDIIAKGWVSNTMVLTDNWFGNTKDNYTTRPILNQLIPLTSWYYLDVEPTATNAIISLKLYDSTTGESSINEDYNLPNFTININQENLNLEKTEIQLNKTGQYDLKYIVNSDSGLLSAQYETSKVTQEVYKGDFNILQELINNANDGDVITLTRNYTYRIGFDSITDGIEITKNGLTIDGNGYTIDAKGQSRIFKIYDSIYENNNEASVEGDYITLKNINFVNGFTTNGAAIYLGYHSDYLTINNCNFSENYADDYGTLYIVGDYSTITYCNFVNNTAGWVAGAIFYYHDTRADISNSKFINNSAIDGGMYMGIDGGGAVYSYDAGKINIDKSVFIKNSAKNLAGSSIYVSTYAKAVSINNSIFLNNVGLMDIFGPNTISIDNSWFGNAVNDYNTRPGVVASQIPVNNWYYLDIDTDTDYHAIISLKLYNPTTQTSSINENYNLPDFTLKLTKTNLVFDESEIKLNKTGQYDVQYTSSSTTGSITAQYETVKLTETVALTDFEKLKKLIDDANANGVIELTRNYTRDELDTIVNGIDINKNLTINGNGYTIDARDKSRIFNIQSGASGLTLVNITFANAKAESGGAIYSGCNNINIVNCTFVNNSATSGGAIYAYSQNLIVVNSTFENNGAGYGAAIYFYTYANNGQVINCTFTKNNANGQAVVLNFAENFKLDKSLFVENIATDGYWDAIFRTTKSNTVVSNTIFLNNKGKIFNGNGGTFTADYNWYGNTEDDYSTNPNTGITINNWYYLEMDTSTENHIIVSMKLYDGSTGSINENYALRNITFNISQKNLGIHETEIKLNKTGQYDLEYELLSENGYATVQFENVEITKAFGTGDFDILQSLISAANENDVIVLDRDYEYIIGIDTITSGIVIDKDNLVIDGNGHTIDAKQMSRIFSVNSGALRVTIKNITLINGKSSAQGGAINWQGAYGKLINVTFDANYAETNGGAVYLKSVDSEVINCTFTNNYAKVNDGAVSVQYNTNIYNSTFIENKASQHGGAISTSYKNVKIDKSLFIKNTANDGGAIFWTSGENGNISNSIFLDNVAIFEGNNIYYKTGSVTADYNWFGNTADNYQNDFTSCYNLAVNKWLFLNANYDNPMIIGKDNTVQFVFSVYNGTGVSAYNSSKVHDYDWTLTSVNGETDKNTIVAGEDIVYTTDSVGSGSIAAKNGGIELTITFDNKYPTEITAPDSITVYVNENKEIGASLTPEGTLTYSVDNSNSYVSNGFIYGLSRGSSNLTIKFAGNTTHEAAEVTIPVYVIKYDTEFICDNTVSVDWDKTLSLNDIIKVKRGDVTYSKPGDIFTLTFTSNDTNVVSVDSNGVITGVNAGKANITVKLDESADTKGSEVNITVTVNKISSEITFSNNITFDYLKQNTTTVAVTGGTIDLENITVVGQSGATITLNNNVITVSNLNAGKYTLKVVTTPDSNHNSVEGTVNITVNKISSEIAFSNDIVFDYLSSDTTTVTLTGASSIIYEVLNHPEATVTETDNVITVSGLDAGSYTLSVTTVPDDNHIQVTETLPITVNKIDSEITFSNDIVFDYLSQNTTTVTVTGGSVDLENISVIGQNEAVISIENNVITVSNLNAGEYTLKVVSTPDKNHNSVENTVSITVNKIDSVISLDDIEYEYGSTGSGIVTVTGGSVDLVNITVLDNNAQITLDANEITVTGLDKGEYTLKVVSTPDKNHKSVEKTVKLTVKINKSYNYDVNSQTLSISWGDDATLSAVSDVDGLTGVVKFYDLSDANKYLGEANLNDEITFPHLSVGNHNINASFEGALNYAPKWKNITVHVDKVHENGFNVNVEPGEYTYGDSAKINATVKYSDATGNVSYYIDGKFYKNATINSEGFIINNLTAGHTYEITAKYAGDENYDNDTITRYLKVNKASSVLNIENIESVDWPNDIIVYYNLVNRTAFAVSVKSKTDAEFELTENDENVIITDSTITIKNLKADEYRITLTNPENDNYTQSSDSKDFSVNKISSAITIDDFNFDFESSQTQTVTLDGSKALTNVVIEGFENSIRVNGLDITISGLNAGTYTLNATTVPDENHTAVTASVKVTVNKINSILTINDVTFDYGSSNTTAVSVTGATAITAEVVGHDGKAAVDGFDITVSGLDAGSYVLKVTTVPDDNHISVTEVSAITVNRINSTLNLNDITFDYGTSNTTVVSVTGADGITAVIEGHESAVAVDGFDITVSGLDAGSYILKVTTQTNNNYNPVTKIATVTVNKVDSTLEIANDITFNVGESNTTEITYTGADSVTAAIEGVSDAVITVKDGIINVSALKAGEYTLTVTTVTDSNHNSVTKTAKVTVSKVESEITADPVEVNEGKTATITVDLPDDATGYVLVEVDNVKTFAEVKNGQATIAIDDLASGEYTAKVTYTGDDKHAAKTIDVDVKIKALENPNVDITIGDITVEDDLNIEVDIPDDATGDVTVYVDGKKYTSLSPADAKDGITVSDLASGEHYIEVVYSGDENYTSASAAKSVKVDKKETQITVSGTNVTFADKTVIKVEITDGATGIVIVNLNGTEYSLNISQSKQLEITLDKPGLYDLSARYLGDEKYNATESQNVKIEAYDKKQANLNVEITDNPKAGQTVTITVTCDSNAPVTVLVNNEKKTLNNNKVIIPNIGIGNYNIAVSVDENNEYNGDYVSKSFTISKKQAEITIKVPENIKVGDNPEIDVTSYEGAKIKVLVDGVEYEIKDGYFTIENIQAGNHTVLVKIDETADYFEASESKIFEVKKEKITLFTVEGKDVKVGEKSTVTVVTDLDKDATVIVNINGTEYAVNLTKGFKLFDIVLDKVGTYTLSARYLENDKVLPAETTGPSITVSDKDQPEIKIEVPQTVYAGSDIEINVTGLSDVPTVLVNGEEKQVKDGKVTLENISAGVYTITASVGETSNYHAETKTLTFEAVKNNSTVTINPIENIKAGQDVEITATTDSDADIIIYVDGVKYAGSLKNISAGTHTVVASVGESDKYLASAANMTFTVTKNDSEITVNATGAVSGAKSAIKVNVTDGATGIVIITVNGTEYSLNISQTKTLEIALNTPGEYEVSAKYLGDEIFTASESQKTAFTVIQKSENTITVNVKPDIKAGDDVEITADSISGDEVTVYVDGVKYEGSLKNISEGVHTITASTPETDSYSASNTTVTFTVSKRNSVVKVNGTDARTGEKSTITVNLTDGATGIVIVNVNGTEYSINISKTDSFEVTFDKAGTYEVSARYLGDYCYQSSESQKETFTVTDKDQTQITVEVPQNIKAGDNIVINITADSDSPLTVHINGEVKEIINGKVTLNNVSSGVYTIEVNAGETATSQSAKYNDVFTVEKTSQTVTIEVPQNIKAGSDAVINISSTGDGELTVYVDGVKQNIADGKVTIKNTAYGTHTVVVNAGENTKYLANTSDATFTVTKSDITVDISGTNVKTGDKTTITVDISDDATGIVIVNVNGTEYSLNISKTKTISAVLESEGEYTITATYLGDDKFNTAVSETKTIIAKDKTTPEIEITANGANVEVTLPQNATGDVEVTVDGKLVSVTKNGNKYAADISGLNPGKHSVEVRYSGNDEYAQNTTGYEFEIPKITPEVKVKVSEINDGQKATLNITIDSDAEGIILVDVDGKNYYAEIINGSAMLEIEDLSIGTHTATVTYNGNDKYGNTTVTADIKVYKRIVPEILITASADLIHGTDAYAIVNMPNDIEGNFTVYVDGVQIGDNDAGSVVSAYLGKLNAGKHYVEIRYNGDEKYAPANANKTLNVLKLDTSVEASCEETNKGQTAVIEITVKDSDATGIVLLDINGNKIYSEIENGKASVKIDDLPAGEYNATVTYTGDEKYSQQTASVKVKVNELTVPEITVKLPDEVTVDKKATAEVTLPDDAKGNISVYVDGKLVSESEVKSPSDEISLGDLTVGQHTVEIRYSGDGKYAPANSTKTLSVNKLTTRISAENVRFIEGESGYIYVVLENIDATGIVLVEVGNLNVYGVIDYSIAVIDISQLASGEYTATIKYLGDAKYNEISTTATVSVVEKAKPVDTQINITVPNTVEAGQTPVVNATLPEDVSGTVTVSVDGKIVYTGDAKAVNTVPLDSLASGSHVVEVAYSGDAKYAPASGVSSIAVVESVKRLGTRIESNYSFSRQANDYYSDGTKDGINGERGDFFYARLVDENGKPVANALCYIAVNGPIYNVTTDDDGYFGVQVNLAVANTYTYALSFLGNDEYGASFNSTKLIMYAKKTSITASAKTFKATAKTKTISVKLNTVKNPYDGKVYLKKGKKITLTINGKTYTAKTNANGVAKFNIKLTKKGKFTTKIKFAGDKTYSASSKTIKITIK